MATLSLRRATRIRNNVERAINELRALAQRSTTVTLDLSDTNPQESLDRVSNEFLQYFARHEALLGILTRLRGKIGQANAISGVNDALTDRSRLTAYEQFVSSLLAYTRPALTEAQLVSRLALVKTSYDAGNVAPFQLTFDTTPTETLATLRASQRTLKSELDRNIEFVESVNVSTEIEIADADLDILAAEGLV